MGRLKMQDLTMADQIVLLHCWTSYNRDQRYVSIFEIFKRYSLHKLTLLYLLTLKHAVAIAFSFIKHLYKYIFKFLCLVSVKISNIILSF